MSSDPGSVVDVGVVTWNTRDLTVAALRTLLDTDQGCTVRLLVRDNASDDGTPEALAEQVPEADVEVGTRNLGFGRGMNRLLARSTSPWFLALNSDAYPQPRCIGELVAAGDRHPRAAAVAPRLERPDGGLEHSTHPFPSLRVAATVATGLPRRFPRVLGDRLFLEGAWAHDRPRSVDWAVGAALLMRRAAVEEIGGFDERFFMYAEDLEWCWRASRRGWSVWFEPGAVVRHVGDASGSQSYGDARTAAYLRNTYAFYRREHGLASTLAYRLLNLAGTVRNERRARRRGDLIGARHWRSLLRVHLRPAGPDPGPPAVRDASAGRASG